MHATAEEMETSMSVIAGVREPGVVAPLVGFEEGGSAKERCV